MAKAKATSLKVKPKQSLEARLQILKVDENYREGIHNALRRSLLPCRFLGLLPVAGLMHPTSAKLKFTFRSPYTIVYVISFLGQIFMTVTSLSYLRYGCDMTNIINSIFYTSCFVATLILVHIGRNWPRMVTRAEVIERQLPPFTRNIARYCDVTMVFVLCAAFVEHLLSTLYGLKVAYTCDPHNVLEVFFTHNMPYVFQYTSYSLWKGIITEILNFQATFLWSFNDLLIMVCSIYLAEHLLTHNDKLKRVLEKEPFQVDPLRIQFTSIVKLVTIVNDNIGPYILTSFACNLFWICMQLFNSLNKNNTGHFNTCTLTRHDRSFYSFEHTFYFAYSFAFLMTKSLLVALLAARIRLISVEPLIHLYQVSAENYTVEVQRFIYQVKHTKVALSGLGFFFVTRQMILTLVGTIVTYELVLLQFNIGGSLDGRWSNSTIHGHEH